MCTAGTLFLIWFWTAALTIYLFSEDPDEQPDYRHRRRELPGPPPLKEPPCNSN